MDQRPASLWRPRPCPNQSQLLTIIILLFTICLNRGCLAQLVSGCYREVNSSCSDRQQTISGDLSAHDCCLGDGYFYKTPDGNCHQCIVYGWLNDTFQGEERDISYPLNIGYSKGTRNTELRFQYTVLPGSVAGEGITSDFYINPPSVLVSDMPVSANSKVTLSLRLIPDSIAQEQPETFTVQLSLAGGVTPPEDSFFRNEIEITIIDSDTTDVFFSADSFSTNEGEMELQIKLVKTGARLAHPVTLTLTPMNVTQAQTAGISTANIPDDNSHQPNRARSFPETQRDFSIESVDVTFPADLADRVEKTVSIVITDDEINEATQYFIIELTVKVAMDRSTISLATRNTTLGVIHDNDPIRIGFEFPSYTFLEEDFDHEVQGVFIAKENNVVSEQTFIIVVEARAVTPNNSIGPAIHNRDYFIGQETRVILLQIPPQQQKIRLIIDIYSDTEIERVESFQVSATSDRRDGIPRFSSPLVFHQSAFVFILDNDDAIVGFEQNYTVMESAGSQEICVNASQPGSNITLPFAIPIRIVRTSSGQDGFEFPLEGVELTLSDVIRRSCFNLSIVDDKALSPDLLISLQLQLDGYTPPNVVLEPTITEVRVVDDDDVGLRLNQTLLQNNTVIQINKVGNDPDSRIECFSRRGRPMTAVWYLPDGTAVTQSSCQNCFYMARLGHGIIVLYRTGIVVTFLGLFRCEFADETGEVQNVFVNIVPFVEVQVTATTSIARIGYPHSLVCSVSGEELLFRPTLVYHWIKSPDIEVGTNSDTLTFNSVQFSDANDYRCEVSVNSIVLTEEVQQRSEAYSLSITSFLFEVRLSGISDCVLWRGANTAVKLQGILNTIALDVDQQCQCGFSSDQMSDSAFYCFKKSPHSVTLRGTLTQSTQNSAMELLNQFQNWTSSTNRITVSGIRLEIDNSCPVLIISEEDPECLSDSSSTPPSNDNTALIGGIAGGVVVILIILLALFLILVIIIVLKKKKQRKKSLNKQQSCIEMHPVEPAGQSIGEVNDIYEEIDDTYDKVVANVKKPVPLKPIPAVRGTGGNEFRSRPNEFDRFNYTGCPAYMTSTHVSTSGLQQGGGTSRKNEESAPVDEGLYEN